MSYVESAGADRKLTGFALVVLFHVALGYALVNGLARRIIEVVHQPLETKIIEEIKPPPPDKPPPPPPPRLAAPPPPFIPPPEVQVQVPLAPSAITAVPTARPTEAIAAPGQRPAVQAAPRPAAPVRKAPVVDANACEKPQYPPAALRAQETGIVVLGFLIDVDGKVLESKVERSSGYRRLDEAARNGLGLCKFTPASLDGKPERAWARIEYEWKID